METGNGASGHGGFSLPVGTVTFLLTDIEGSTRLWEAEHDAMAIAVPRHYALLTEAVARHRGVQPVEQGEGDSIVAAFARASDAIAAAVDAQLALHAEPWPEGAPLRVRIAVHTGEAHLRDEGNYFGVAINRCARLRATAHGGQIVVSRAVHDLVADSLTGGVELVDLGTHRLRDLGRPEQVFGVVHPDLPAGFEPLRSLDAFATNLPDRLTSFVGREAELASLAEALVTERVVTLTGAGGCGKTRLALQAAADALDRFPDGAWWVELAPLQDGGLLAETLCDALGVTPLPGISKLAAAVAFLESRTALVILDNCEHLLSASADLVEELARGCPRLTLLMTSRSPLGVEGEHAWRVPSLSLPASPSAETIDVLTQADAVRLFIDRARQVRPNFAVTDDNAPAVAQICHDLDGIPLAIELAAARVRVLAVEQIASALTDRFRLLTGSTRGALPRQQTLRASVDWSHDLLREEEQVLLRRLGVFMGGWTLEACEQVCADEQLPRLAILDLLTALVDRSLVQADETAGAVRYSVLETVRQYALERLRESGEEDVLRDRHLAFMLAFAEDVAPRLFAADQDQWLDRFDAERPNLAAGLEHASATAPEAALRLCASQTFLWKLRGRLVEAEGAFSRALDAAGGEPPALVARVLWGRAYLGVYAGSFDTPVEHAQEALRIARELGDDSTAARALDVLATVGLFPDPRSAVQTAEDAMALARQAGDDWCLADAGQIAAFCWMFLDRFEEVERTLDEVDAIVARLGHREFASWQLQGRAYAFYRTGDIPAMRAAYERAVAPAREVGEPASESAALACVGLADVHAGRAEEAVALLDETLALVLRTGAGLTLPLVTCYRGWALAAAGRRAEAREVLTQTRDAYAVGYAWLLPTCDWLLAQVHLHDGAADAARAHAEMALQRPHAPWHAARANHVLARIASAQGRWADADRHAHACLDLLVEHGIWIDVALALDALAEAAAGLESHDEAARLLGAAARAREDRGLVRWAADEEHFTALAARLGEELGERELAEACAEGRELSTTEAIAWARRARGSRARPSAGWESLTPTELQIADLVAEGLTNVQIGERMFISRGTAKVHVSNVLRKLGMTTRSEIAAEATRRSTQAHADA